jgi:hypothetical protein
MAIDKQIEIEISYLKTWFLTVALEIFTKVNKTRNYTMVEGQWGFGG